MNKTTRKISWAFLLMGILCPGFFVVQASEVFSSGDVMESGSWALSAYGRSLKAEPQIELSGVSAVAVPTSGGSTTLFSNSNADVEMDQKAEEVVMSAAFRPREGLTYKMKVG